MEVKEIIEKLLKKRKISLYQLAKEVNVSYNQAWRWKHGKTKNILPIFRKKLEELLQKGKNNE